MISEDLKVIVRFVFVHVKVCLITQQVEGPLQSFIKLSDQKTYLRP